MTMTTTTDTTIIKILYTCTVHESIERHTFQQSKVYDDRTYRLTAVKFTNSEGREVGFRGELPRIACSQCDYNKIGDNAIMTAKAIKGRIVESVPCADKCINATGPSCDCACGGENHGGTFDLNQRII
tara:strand:+ start:463 stop:846 length:384 start_codon:yes stop_codon:yes gene_type:complete